MPTTLRSESIVHVYPEGGEHHMPTVRCVLRKQLTRKMEASPYAH